MPWDKSYIILGNQKHARVRSYSMNYYMGLYEEIPFNEKKYTRLSSIESPSDRWVFIDEHEDCIMSGQFLFFLVNWKKFGWHDFPAARHAGAGVISFADGHVETKKWLDARTRAPVLRVRQIGSVTGTANNEDVLWLWQRTTTPLP